MVPQETAKEATRAMLKVQNGGNEAIILRTYKGAFALPFPSFDAPQDGERFHLSYRQFTDRHTLTARPPKTSYTHHTHFQAAGLEVMKRAAAAQ